MCSYSVQICDKFVTRSKHVCFVNGAIFQLTLFDGTEKVGIDLKDQVHFIVSFYLKDKS